MTLKKSYVKHHFCAGYLVIDFAIAEAFDLSCNCLHVQGKQMDKSSSLLQSTVTKIGNMMQGAGGVRHMLVLIVFAFVMVS